MADLADCQWCKEITESYGIESDENTLEIVQRTTTAAVSMRDALATNRVKLAELEQQNHDLRGDLAASQLLCADYDRDRQQLRRERNVAAEARGEGHWFWSDTDPNDLDSFASDATVVMRAEQLRALLALTGGRDTVAIAAVREVLADNGCDCVDEIHDENDDEHPAEPCLACRVEAALR